MFDHFGFVDDAEQKRLRQMLDEIAEHKPYYSASEKITLGICWKADRHFTIAESREIVGIHLRIGIKKKAGD